jgi:hypothetical protein
VSVSGQVIEYDTNSTSALVLECPDLTGDPYCMVDTGSCGGWSCGISDSTTGRIFCGGGLFVPKSAGDSYTLSDCPEGNVAKCDAACTCVTGSTDNVDGSFVPDGGSCPILSTTDGTLEPYPTMAPTEVGSPSPTIDLDVAILYDGAGLPDDIIMFVSCDSEVVYCDNGGSFILGYAVIGVDNTRAEGWGMCLGDNDVDCLLPCSPVCSCTLLLFDNESGNTTETGEDCPLYVPPPTDAPASVPAGGEGAGLVGALFTMTMMMMMMAPAAAVLAIIVVEIAPPPVSGGEEACCCCATHKVEKKRTRSSVDPQHMDLCVICDLDAVLSLY